MKLNGKTLAALIVAGGISIGGMVGSASAQNKQGDKPPTDKPVEKQPEVKKEEKKDGKAAATAKIGETAPAFELTDTDGKAVKLSDFKDKIVVLQWFNPDCPFVQKFYQSKMVFNDMYNDYKGKDVVFLAINSGAPGNQGYGKDRNAKAKTDWKIAYPILLDEKGAVGHAYNATSTPGMYVIGKDGKLAYRGAIDNKKDFDAKEYKNYVRQALDQVIKGETVTEPETRSYGCNVKYAA